MTISPMDQGQIPIEWFAFDERRRKHWQTADRNFDMYLYWRHRLRSVAMASFRYLNMPDDIDPRFIELMLLDTGLLGFFEPVKGLPHYKVAMLAPRNRLTDYWNPNKITLISQTHQHRWTRHADWWVKRGKIMAPDAAVLFDNYNRQNIAYIINTFAQRLSNADRKVDINVNAQATPYIISAPEELKKSITEIYKQISGNEPLIATTPAMADLMAINSVNLQAPFVAPQLQDVLNTIWNQALILLGVNGMTREKAERLVNLQN